MHLSTLKKLDRFAFIKGNLWGQEEANTEELHTKAT